MLRDFSGSFSVEGHHTSVRAVLQPTDVANVVGDASQRLNSVMEASMPPTFERLSRRVTQHLQTSQNPLQDGLELFGYPVPDSLVSLDGRAIRRVEPFQQNHLDEQPVGYPKGGILPQLLQVSSAACTGHPQEACAGVLPRRPHP